MILKGHLQREIKKHNLKKVNEHNIAQKNKCKQPVQIDKQFIRIKSCKYKGYREDKNMHIKYY